MQAKLASEPSVEAAMRRLRSLVRAGRQQIARLRPVWGAYLLGETLSRMSSTLDELERHVLSSADADAGGESGGLEDEDPNRQP